MMKQKMLVLMGMCQLIWMASMAQPMNVVTYNIRYDIQGAKLKANGWEQRGPVIASLIRFYDFDIVGTQEGMLHQLDYLKNALPAYTYVGVGREDGLQGGEHSAVFYKKERFEVIDKGDFWLSETPEVPSKGWDATCCHRLCSWACFKDLVTGKEFYVFNAHYDHQGKKARKESSKLVLKKIQKLAGNKPVVFMGDLNAPLDSEPYATIANSEELDDTYRIAPFPYTPNGSFNGFGKRTGSKEIIDHVFVSDHFKVKKWGILTDTYHGNFPSDHFPIFTSLELK
jgi:endonuclease/exonuclease/phosphatase family metal-dependent hydrolase